MTRDGKADLLAYVRYDCAFEINIEYIWLMQYLPPQKYSLNFKQKRHPNLIWTHKKRGSLYKTERPENVNNPRQVFPITGS